MGRTRFELKHAGVLLTLHGRCQEMLPHHAQFPRVASVPRMGQVHLRPQIAVNLRAIQRSLQNADRPYRDVVEELRYGTPGKRGEIA